MLHDGDDGGWEESVRERVLLGLYGTWITALSILFYVRPDQGPVIWGAIGVSSAAAIVVGALRNRPRRRAPWLLLAAAMFTFVVGDTIYNIRTDLLGVADPTPGVQDLFYLAMYPLIFVGLVSLTRAGMSRPDRAGVLDALIVTVGLAMFFWIFRIQPYVTRIPEEPLESVISIGYPVGDILVLASVVRMITTVRRSLAPVLLTVGTLGLLVADVFYGISELEDTWEVGGPVDLGWILLYATWGAAALLPSMAQLTEPRIVVQNDISWVRLGLIGLSSLAAPVVLLIEAFTNSARPGTAPHAAVIGIFSIALFLLVIGRLGGVVAMHRQALARERALRQAGAALVATTDADGVTGAVKKAVANLLPPGTNHRVLVRGPAAPRDEETSRLSTPEAPWLAPIEVPRNAIEAPHPAGAQAQPRAGGWTRDLLPAPPATGRGVTAVYRRGLDPRSRSIWGTSTSRCSARSCSMTAPPATHGSSACSTSRPTSRRWRTCRAPSRCSPRRRPWRWSGSRSRPRSTAATARSTSARSCRTWPTSS
ncbi:hypothetical protein ACFQX7_03270 [Luedemannella flava]